MLIGNCAGWLHIGCVDSATSCCTGPVADSASDSSHLTACCAHSHCHTEADQASRHATESDAGEATASDSAPGEHPGSQPHDSDHCSICQSFSATRNAAFIVQLPIAGCVHQTHFAPIIPDSVSARSLLGDSISVRGPPRV
ncbi:hypothetical protein [Roseimaritima ulvae]|uniref:hypothetical protein n=1 Tax=Roseimaritima ulvae TaxID=980254 RepID=UPI0011CD4ADB|nr:hypothetical protein [Roseimaritima ulvae]